MLRAGARHPDADECPSPVASTSRATEPELDVQQLYDTLDEYLLLEPKFRPKLCLPADSEFQNEEVTIGARDGAAHVLRCLKVWYDLPASVLIHAINLFDRFLTKMKVRPCHVPCITVSCMNIAIDEHARATKATRNVTVEELVSISQSACTEGDVARMSRVIVDKLALCAGPVAVTAHEWLWLLTRMLQQETQESELVNLLEIAACDAACANARPSVLALVIICQKIEQELVDLSRRGEPMPDTVYYLYEYVAQLQARCHMSSAALLACRAQVRDVLARYEARAAAPQRQRLVWRLSERTLKVLRPTDRLTSLLPTIEEQQHLGVDTTPPRNRSGSESSEEDTCDWPRSPVLPVYCDN